MLGERAGALVAPARGVRAADPLHVPVEPVGVRREAEVVHDVGYLGAVLPEVAFVEEGVRGIIRNAHGTSIPMGRVPGLKRKKSQGPLYANRGILTRPARGFPAAQGIPLNFNPLSSRAGTFGASGAPTCTLPLF